MQHWGIIQFPGSNSDLDAYRVFEQIPGIKVSYHWHEDSIQKDDYQVMVIPGGFSFGDYLRTGAIAKLSNAVQSLPEAIEAGMHVIGICNGFQILLEARLLPGMLQVNKNLKFISKKIDCEIVKPAFPWFQESDVGKTLELPIAHGCGNYQIKAVDLSEVQAAITYKENPNGSFQNIAGVYRSLGKGSIFGLMPHPERAALEFLHRRDGELFWKNAKQLLAA